MVKGNASQTRVHYKGPNTDEDFIIMVDSPEDLKAWKGDKTIPLGQVVNGFKIFVTHKQGVQGVLDTASKAILEDEFGTHKDDDVISQILQKGTVQEHAEAGRGGDRNASKGEKSAHGPNAASGGR